MNDFITQVTEHKGRVQIIINGDQTFWMSLKSFLEKSFTVGDPIDIIEFKQWLLAQQYSTALNNAVSLLAIRARSRMEILKKLQEKGYMEKTIELVMYKLEKENLLNDDAFARDWANARMHHQIGKTRILAELRQKGIPNQIAQQILAELPTEEIGRQAVQFATKMLRRYSRELDSRKAMQKVLSAMSRHGYSYHEASKAIEEAVKQMKTDAE